ncbi:MAG: flagellar biosynthetic protein FliO [Polymorphobacter sp.]|uniref:flagellar biosynthetic protein FliO n=1 Tax=Polymorphobacter sp. TaxID=1909290 RepID=UPI003A84AA39
MVRLADRVRGFAVAADARRHARVVQTVPLGPGSRLLVVEFGGRRLLIGQARGGLLRLDASEAEA